MTTQPIDASASTYGWDTAFAIRIRDVNSAILRNGASPRSFSFEAPDQSCSLQGSFGDWQVTAGGDGNLIHMAIPVPAATLEFNAKSFPINAATVTLEVRLHYIPHTGNLVASSGTLHDLVVIDSATPDDPDGSVASVIDLSFAADSPGDLVVALARESLNGWFNANLGEFSHVFSTVNLNRTADKAQFQWLMPTYTGYAYMERGSSDDSLLGILCMTGNRDAGGLVEQLSPAAIPAQSRAGFLIGSHRFIDQMVLPALPAAFKGIATTDLEMTTDGKGLKLKNDVRLDPVTQDGKSYTPRLQTLNITVNETTLGIEILTRTKVSAGVYAYCQHTAAYTIGLKQKTDGTQTLVYQADPDSTPTTTHWTATSPGIEIAKELVAIIAFIVAIIVGILTDGAGLVPALLVAGLLVGSFDEGVKIAEAIGTDDAPSMDLLVLNSTDPVVWTDSGDFSLTWAGLSDSLQMGGNPLFAGTG